MKVALCCIGRLENNYVVEYVEWYKKLGFDKIFIYDNNHNGEENFEDAVGEYVSDGFVNIVGFRNKEACQWEAYTDCYNKHNKEYDWIAFFDFDEFLVLKKDDNVKSFLSKFKEFDCIKINWMLYTDNDMVDTDGRLLNERLTEVAPLDLKVKYDFPENYHVKSFVRGGIDNFVWRFDAHVPHMGLKCCNSDGECAKESPFEPYKFDTAYLKHFFTKTIGEFLRYKLLRGIPDVTYDEFIHKKDYLGLFFIINKKTKEKEDFIKKEKDKYMQRKTIVHLYTLCYNEIDILPFVVDYWKRFVTKVIVYDNGSTDGSVEYLKQFDWVEVRYFETDGMNDIVIRDIKNTCWYESRGKADYVVVCDMDECLYFKNTDIFLDMKNKGCTICAPKWYDFISEERPIYTEGKLLHEISNKAVLGGGKTIIFDPNKIQEINYSVGAHFCKPIGDIKYYNGDIYVLHINKHLSLEYLIEKYHYLNKRLSEENRRNKLSIHYTFSDELLKDTYEKDLKRAINFNDLVNAIDGNDNLDIFIGGYKKFKPAVTNPIYKIIIGNHNIENDTNLELINCKHESALDDNFYSEIYMLDYISKNYFLKKYVGFCHYRKYWSFMDNIPNVEEVINNNSIIVAKPIKLKRTVKGQYASCHNMEDLYLISGIISEMYPSYINLWNVFLNGHMLFPYNMFIMTREEFIEYVRFVKSILDRYVEIVGTDIVKRIENNKEKYLKEFSPNNSVDYQYRIGGYLAERLTNLWIIKHHQNVMAYDVKITEPKYEYEKNVN